MTTIDTEKLYSITEYEALPENDKKYELVEGRLVAKHRHYDEIEERFLDITEFTELYSRAKSRLGAYLEIYIADNKLGVFFNSNAHVRTVRGDFDTVRRPDLAFYAD